MNSWKLLILLLLPAYLVAVDEVSFYNSVDSQPFFDAHSELPPDPSHLPEDENPAFLAARRAQETTPPSTRVQPRQLTGTSVTPTKPLNIIRLTPGIDQPILMPGQHTNQQTNFETQTPAQKSATLLTNQVKNLVAMVESPDQIMSIQTLRQRIAQYEIAYGKNKTQLSADDQDAFNPLTVVTNLMKRLSTSVGDDKIAPTLVQGIAGESLTTKILASDATLQAKENARVTGTMESFIQTVNATQPLFMVMSLQGDLLRTIADNQSMTSSTYKLYYDQYTKTVHQLQLAFSSESTSSMMTLFAQFAARMKTLKFIDFNQDLATQMQLCKTFKSAYNQYVIMAKSQYVGLELDPKAFDFVDTLVADLHNQVALEIIRKSTQTSWQKLVSYVQELIGVKLSSEQKITKLISVKLQDLQELAFTLSQLRNFTESDISDAAELYTEKTAVQSLARLPVRYLSIDIFKNFFGWDPEDQTIDYNIERIFAPDEDESAGLVLAPASLEIFIKYRLLALNNQSRVFNFTQNYNDIFNQEAQPADAPTISPYADYHGTVWRADFATVTDVQLKQFLSTLSVWDAKNQNLVPITMDTNSVQFTNDQRMAVLQQWLEATKAIRTWVLQDLDRINGYMQHPHTIDASALNLIRSYLLIRAAIHQEQSVTEWVNNIAPLCDSQITSPLVLNGLRASSQNPFSLGIYVQQAQKVVPFFNALTPSYTAIENAYVTTVLGNIQNETQNKKTTKKNSKYVFIPYVVSLPSVANQKQPAPAPTAGTIPQQVLINQQQNGPGYDLFEDFEPKCFNFRTGREQECRKKEESSAPKTVLPTSIVVPSVTPHVQSPDQTHDDGYESDDKGGRQPVSTRGNAKTINVSAKK